jgi:hexosaminidase
LRDAEPRAEQLTALTAAGQEALRYLAEGKKAPSGWKAKRIADIEEAKKQNALVQFTFLDALSDLVRTVVE